MKQLDRIIENIATCLLIIIGLAGFAIGLADFVGWEPPFLPQKVPLLVILLIVGLLASAIGLERVGRFRRHDQQLERFENLMARSLGGQHLVRYNEVYDSMTRHVGTLHKRLRTMAVGRSITSPDEWAKTVARRLQETKRAGAPAKFEAILAVDFDNLPPDFQQGIESRLNLYKKAGVRDLVSLYILDLKPPIGFDVHIVDKEHLILALTTLAGVKDTPYGISFENQPLIASEFADWYDQIVLKKAIPYEEWIQKQQQKSGV